MSTFETAELSGALFTNDKKEKDSQPDMKGNAKVDGVEYWVAGWWETSKSGLEYLSIKLTEKEAAEPPARKPASKSAPAKSAARGRPSR